MSDLPKTHFLHSGYFNSTLRDWQTLNTDIAAKNLMYPLFITDDDDAIQPVNAMPGVSRFGINKLKEHLASVVANGLTSVLLFGVTDKLEKDLKGSSADCAANPVVRVVPKLREWFPHLTIACDVCLCPYTKSGHCGILNDDGSINNAASLARIAEISLAYAQSGAHIVAPSDMMDGRIGAIKERLFANGLGNKVAVLSYAVKFASSFYGPFREAAKSAPAFGDRKCYQLPAGSRGLAHRAVARDVAEGADFLMVKPALAYLDLVRETKTAYPDHPLFVYQVSGEYAMIYHGAQAAAFDLKTILTETLTSMRRAGADVIISYFTPLVLEWLQRK